MTVFPCLSCSSRSNSLSSSSSPSNYFAGGWGVLRSFSVYSWNFRMVLRRLHAEYGVNAFFRVDVVAHPNFPDKSIVRVSFFFFYSPFYDNIESSSSSPYPSQRLRLRVVCVDTARSSSQLHTEKKSLTKRSALSRPSPFFYYCCRPSPSFLRW